MINSIYAEIGESKSPETAKYEGFQCGFRNRSSKIRIETNGECVDYVKVNNVLETGPVK